PEFVTRFSVLAVLAAVAAGLTVFIASLSWPVETDRKRTRSRSPILLDSATSVRAAPVRGRAKRGKPVLISLVLAVTSTAAVILIGPFTVLAIIGVVVAIGVRIAGRNERRRQRRIDETAPDLIDLFGIALAAGQPVATALT